ncbi:putative F-box domain-containing protein [Helianthus annuus]|nr:putative F-box domain-containing protein [Helianthus annuus]KAJ0766923.1 putative F-box domain-containing protein [Helianthus annuus]
MHHKLFISTIKSKSHFITTMSDVPTDVLVNILSRLPVKSLLRFRTVSKPLCALIDSPYFVNLHRQRQSMKTDKVLVFSRGVGSSTSAISFCFDSLPTTVRLEPPIDRTLFPYIIGSCHGFICFCSWPMGRVILLWNPSTRKYREVPASLDYPPINNVLKAVDQVGYDHVNNDYKVVRLTQSGDSVRLDSKVFVYSLNFERWLPVEQTFPYDFLLVSCRGQGACVSGAVHWLLNQKPDSDNDYLMVSFDLASQSFQSVPLPEFFNNYENIDIGVFEGCLCVVGSGGYCVDVWVMGEYEVKESWSKLLALTSRVRITCGSPSIRPILYLKNRKEVLLEVYERWFEIYDLEEKKSKKRMFRAQSPLSTFVYQDSLA